MRKYRINPHKKQPSSYDCITQVDRKSHVTNATCHQETSIEPRSSMLHHE